MPTLNGGSLIWFEKACNQRRDAFNPAFNRHTALFRHPRDCSISASRRENVPVDWFAHAWATVGGRSCGVKRPPSRRDRFQDHSRSLSIELFLRRNELHWHITIFFSEFVFPSEGR